ncbi:nuclear mitotic apparatus protein 1 isoform X2 [Tachysurus fulvidraco]|uniref:nuclear mitotic apparatus protein 1 isoform X2 n=1 Tax=Tachysurus fulvidraco TaxID=1234273 RepID=UPI001FED2F8B|nr:nuclear mitotic apparatus protein 1 isoform X2 [Tachysurus fulvidraco]
MALHPSKEDALLTWLNGLQLDEPVQRITQLQDGILLLKLVYKLGKYICFSWSACSPIGCCRKGEDPSQTPVHLPQAERLSIISDFLHSVCPVECVVLTLAKGRMLELELTKVVLLLCYYGVVNNSLVPKVGFETELQMATMLRYVRQEASGLCLREGLDKLLATSSLIYTSSVSSTSSVSEDGSPFFPRARSSPFVNFVELDTVASSSFVGSPLQELMSTPQVQVKRLRKELAHEGDVRDELERELAERIALLSDKEGQMSQLQHRLQRLQRDQEEMEKEHKATLTELQQKNEGLLARVHEVLKQCRDLKTDNSQKERRLDELMEENGTLAAQARNAFAQLARAEEEVAKITEAHNSSQTEWGNRRDLLQRELSQAITDRECLSEQIQISQGKISVLEDELAKLSQQPQEKGEVLGPIVEQEKLKQELTDLTQKLSKLEETISLLEKEKMSLGALLAEDRSSFEKETLRLEGRISDLQQSIKNMQAEKDAQEQASRTTQETLTSQIAALETDLAHLQQLEVHLTAEIATSAELRQQRGMLEAKVTSLEDMVNMLQSTCQNMEAENATQQEVLNAVRADLQNAQISLVEYEKRLADHQKVVEENASLRARISALDDTIADLQTEIDAQRKRGDELLTANEQQKALMEEKFLKQEQKAHEMFAELETLSQELRRMKHQKLEAESCIERLAQEGADLKASLAEEQDRGQSQLILVTKAKEEREMELQQIITDHQNKISELQTKIEGTVESLKQSESELTALKEKTISKDGELRIQQKELSDLQYKADDLQRQLSEVEGLSQHLSQDVVSKDREVQHVKAELEQREEEIQTLKVNLQSLEAKSGETRELHQKEMEKQMLAIMELKLQLSEAEKLISEKVQSLQALAQELKGLKEELSIERQSLVTLEISFKASKEAHEVKEQTLRLEVTQLQQEIDGHLKKLEESLNESKSLKEELSRQQDLAFQRESEVSVLAAQNRSLEEDFAQLQNKLSEAITLATERQTDSLKLQEEVQRQENLRAKVQEVEETQRKELQREVTELQARVQKLTSLASERETQLGALNEKMKEQEEYNRKLLQKSDEALQKELENVVDLKGQLESAKSQTAAKNELLESTEEKLKQMELVYQQKVSLISETCQAKEALERRVNELCSKQEQDLETFQQGLETLEREKEHLSLMNESLQSECLALQTRSKEQQDTLNAFKADLQSTQDGYERDLEALKKEKEHLQDKCRSLQTENKGQEEALNTLTADLQKTQDRYQKDVEIMKKENDHLSSVNQSLQIDLQSSQTENKSQHKAMDSLKAELHNTENRFQQEVETLKKEQEQLSTVNQTLQTECQTLQTENQKQQEILNALKMDLQNAQEGFQQELGNLMKEKDHFSSVSQSLEFECQKLQTANKMKLEELNALKADLQNMQNDHQQEMESLKNEKDHLASVTQSLQSKCQTLQAKETRQQEEFGALKADLQENKDKFEKDLEILKNERDQLSSVNQSLQTECQTLKTENKEQQETLNALKANLQNIKDAYRQELETLKNEQENLCCVNQTLQSECKTLQAEKTGQEQALNALKADMQERESKYGKDMEILRNEKEQLALVNQNLQSECQNLQALRTGQEEELNALKADMQESKNKYGQDLETLRNEKEQLASVNQNLHAEKMVRQEELDALKADLQENKDKFNKDLETLKNERDHLASVNQSLLKDLEAAQKVGAELVSVKEVARQVEHELENQVKELQAKIKEISSLADEREAEIRNLHSEVKQQEASRLRADESEKASRAELEAKVVQLQVQCEEACKRSSERDSELSLLRDQYNESEKQKQDACQANQVLENTVSELRLKQKQETEEYLQQLDALAKEKDALTTTLRTDRKAQQEALDDLQSALQQEVKTLQKEKEHLSFINQSLQRECDASQRLGVELEVKLKGQTESFRAIKEALQKKEMQNQELLEQLEAKAEKVEHYKVQVEKAKTHYNGKKQELLEEQKACQTLQASLETSESEGKALKAELKVVSMELENIKASEKKLMAQIKSLETQLAYADQKLREQRKQGEQSVQVQHRENPRSQQAINGSSDSLELNLDDSLNAVGKQSVPGESSTPLVRSSERLAAKRRTQGEGSLETLYFTPMMQERGKKREGASQDHKLESSISSLGELTLDSARKPSSSVRRRRTTQVINITMTKKTPLGGGGAAEADESFFSLHPAQSQPNLASHKARPMSAEIFEDPNKLLSLPGYRRSNAHVGVLPRAPSTFCIGSEYEPDHFSDDWMRIAELQSRNKSCLPHLKSSYPLESRPSLGFSHLPVTDEEVRTGDPTETIRRASTIPSQLKDSIANHRLSLAPPAAASHRFSLAPPAAAAHSHAPSQRAPPVAKAREVRSTRSPLAPKRPAGQVQDLDTPEAKKLASCFPRTPKGRNLRSTNSQNIAPSPADRRQSMAFMIDNTPKKAGRGDRRLHQRALNKLRKSPRTASTKSPKVISSAKKLIKSKMRMKM